MSTPTPETSNTNPATTPTPETPNTNPATAAAAASFKLITALDNVAVAITEQEAGDVVDINGSQITLKNQIPFGHKVALRDIAQGEQVIKYGYPIGVATQPITTGEHVHSHNMKTGLKGLQTYQYEPAESVTPTADPAQVPTFEGYLRKNGRVGVRNELWIIPTVGCINRMTKVIEAEAQKAHPELVDQIHAFTHPYGCSQLGDDLEMTQTFLKGLITHPNAGAVLVLSLGCENNHLGIFRDILGDIDEERVRFITAQKVDDEYEAAASVIDELVELLKTDKRQTLPASKLILGMKCGGSDSFSGFTANPLLGLISDKIITMGGASMLTEVPEMFGAETILMNRAKDETTFTSLVDLINNFKGYFISHGQEIYENPSPGNKEGGITTLEEKSLGCIQKGGRGQVHNILEIGDLAKAGGLNLLYGPGNDLVSTTNLIASGAQIVCFTTGRGNPFGGAVPTLKLASNHALAERKKNWIDFDASRLLDEDPDQVADELFSQILDVASGRKTTKNEDYNYREIAIFKDGVTL